MKITFPLSHGCCDNVKLFGTRNKCRCNDYIQTLPMWKKLVQCIFGVHRENANSWESSHEIDGWKLKFLKFIIKPNINDAPWRWIKTK